MKWFNIQKGFGFIQPDNGGADAFVHISAVERSGMGMLSEGQKVEFELVADRKKRQDVGGKPQGRRLITRRRLTAAALLPERHHGCTGACGWTRQRDMAPYLERCGAFSFRPWA